MQMINEMYKRIHIYKVFFCFQTWHEMACFDLSKRYWPCAQVDVHLLIFSGLSNLNCQKFNQPPVNNNFYLSSSSLRLQLWSCGPELLSDQGIRVWIRAMWPQ